MSMSLYEIDAEILACVDEETGEIVDFGRFEELNMARDAKIESICLWIKNLNAEAAALKAERDAFNQRIKAVESRAESLKGYLTGALNGREFKTTRASVSFRKSEYLVVSDNASIPAEYLRHEEPEVDKPELTKAIKGGLVIEGVQLAGRKNIQIK